ncbi:cellulose binding domain-containing protein [Fibrella aquatica]|uniref:cellulose binding domain-containing protein n=1 Tax=Fibrella aquatica TaxID=3242487 RepID=UPI00351FE089
MYRTLCAARRHRCVHNTLVTGLLLAVMVLLLPLSPAKAQISAFTAAQIETGTGCDWPFSSLAVNPVDGKVYGFWRKGSGLEAIYKLIRFDGSSWTTVSTFAPTGNSGSPINIPNFDSATDDVDIAIDALGRFHVTFRGSRGGGFDSVRGVWYGLSTNGTSWAFTEIQTFSDPSGFKGTDDPVIEIDAANQPHIGFRVSDVNSPRTYGIRYYRFTGTAWVGETAISITGGVPANEVNNFDMAIDGAGKAHMAIQRETNNMGRNGGLVYTTNSSGSWVTPTVLAEGAQDQTQGNTLGIDTDAANKVHIVYSGYPDRINYITNTSGSFSAPQQINGNLSGSLVEGSFHINSNGDKSFGYRSNGLRFAYQPAGAGAWTTALAYTPPAEARAFNYPSAILAPSGRVIILFDNLTTGNGDCSAQNTRKLWYATATVQAPTTPAPSFTQAPTSTAVCTGNTATFTATATGATSFQWQQDDNSAFSSPATVTTGGIYTVSTSGTTSTLSIATNTSANGQYFRAVATNSTGSTNSTGALLTVNALPTPSITGLASAYCKDAVAVTLTGSPTGGNFTVDGNSATSFNPAALATGSHTVVYRYTNGSGCVNTATQNVTVNPLPAVSITGLSSAYCKDAAAVTLTGSPTGGSFTVDGNSATQFNPANLTAGAHSVLYSYTNSNGCTNTTTQSVTVNPLPVVSITGLASAYCRDAATVTLTGTPAGGSFTVDGTSATQFAPGTIALGAHTVRYVYTDNNGCTNATTQNVTVNPLPFLSITGLANAYCQDAGTVTLTATPEGGSFTIDGNSATQFNPATLAVGNRTVDYRYTDSNGCANTATQIVRVKATPPTPTLLTQSGGAYPASQSAVTVDVNSGNVTLLVGGCAGTINWSGPNNSSGTVSTITVATDQPGAFTYQTSCLVDGCASLPATAVVTVGGRLTVLHRDVDNYADNNAIQPLLVLQNQGLGTLPLANVTLRYYLTVEGASALSNLSINYAQLGNQNVQLRYVPLTPVLQGAAGYIEYSFTAGAGSLAPGGSSGPIQAYFAKGDYSGLNERDDYSYAIVRNQLVGNLRITAYYNGVLIAGVEPGTTTQIRALRALTESKNGPSATQIHTYLDIRNEGNVPVNYSDLTARYYFTSDGNERLQVEVDEGNVQTQLVALNPAVGGANYYLEIRFNQSGQLAPGASTGRVRYRISKPSGGRFDQTNDYSYQEQPAESSSNSRVVVYVGADRVWGREPGAAFRMAVAEPNTGLQVTVLGNPVRDDAVSVEITGAGGQPLQLQLITAQGTILSQKQVPNPQPTERHQFSVQGQPAGMLLLQVSTPTERQTIKVLKAE